MLHGCTYIQFNETLVSQANLVSSIIRKVKTKNKNIIINLGKTFQTEVKQPKENLAGPKTNTGSLGDLRVKELKHFAEFLCLHASTFVLITFKALQLHYL